VLGSAALLAACKPYGDSKRELGIIDSNVSQSGLTGTWISSGGSLTLSKPPYNAARGCSDTGQTVCAFFMYAADGPAALTMACADSVGKMNFSYQASSSARDRPTRR
jgi:hypothetical protein